MAKQIRVSGSTQEAYHGYFWAILGTWVQDGQKFCREQARLLMERRILSRVVLRNASKNFLELPVAGGNMRKLSAGSKN